MVSPSSTCIHLSLYFIYALGNQIYSTASEAVVPNLGQVDLSSVNFATPLYCQSPDADSATLSWQLPLLSDGESSGGASAFSASGSLGLALGPSAPEGVYSCVVNGEVVSSVFISSSKLCRD